MNLFTAPDATLGTESVSITETITATTAQSSVTDSNTKNTDGQVGKSTKGRLHTNEIIERFRDLIIKSTDFIICRGLFNDIIIMMK